MTKLFQSTLPARGATNRCLRNIARIEFQSTLPARGATAKQEGTSSDFTISIHAPRTGSDKSSTAHGGGSPDFNPRSPHGERRFPGDPNGSAAEFQSTLPARGATVPASSAVSTTNYFNPRSPHGERPRVRDAPTRAVVISIHAPRTGSDCTRCEECQDAAFQSTLPARGATYRVIGGMGGRGFQSTLPARGATC